MDFMWQNVKHFTIKVWVRHWSAILLSSLPQDDKDDTNVNVTLFSVMIAVHSSKGLEKHVYMYIYIYILNMHLRLYVMCIYIFTQMDNSESPKGV